MKHKTAAVATAALLAVASGSASANGGEVLAGAVIGAVIGSQIGSHGHSSVSVHYGGYAPPVLMSPPVVIAPPVGYAPPPPLYGYARPYVPPTVIYPAPTVIYPAPPIHYGPPHGHWRGHHHHRHFDHDGPRGHGGRGWHHR